MLFFMPSLTYYLDFRALRYSNLFGIISTKMIFHINKSTISFLRCKSYEKAKKKLTISEAPNILTVALKRFQVFPKFKDRMLLSAACICRVYFMFVAFVLQSGKFGKLNKPIQFPEILDLAPFMSGTSDNTPIFRLYGVVVHLDIMNAAFSGHYVCYVKNIQNKWFKVDDSVVSSYVPIGWHILRADFIWFINVLLLISTFHI